MLVKRFLFDVTCLKIIYFYLSIFIIEDLIQLLMMENKQRANMNTYIVISAQDSRSIETQISCL